MLHVGSKRSASRGLAAALLFSLAAGCDGAGEAARAPAQQGAAMSLTASAPAAACGGKGQPDCPLQGWMKSTLQTYQREAKYERLAGAFDVLVEHAPAGFAGWREVAQAGAEAARKQDAAGVRASCKSCHDEQRARYRSEQRAAAWP